MCGTKFFFFFLIFVNMQYMHDACSALTKIWWKFTFTKENGIWTIWTFFWILRCFSCFYFISWAVLLKVSKINVIYIFHISKADNFRLQFEKHTRANPFIYQPFEKIQKFFDRNYSYMLQIQKKLKNPENVESGLQNPDPEFRNSGKFWIWNFLKMAF